MKQGHDLLNNYNRHRSILPSSFSNITQQFQEQIRHYDTYLNAKNNQLSISQSRLYLSMACCRY